VWFRLTGTGNVIAVNACWYFDAYDAIGKVHVYRAGAGGCGDLSCVSTDVSGGACSFPFVFFPEWRFCAEAGAEYFILALPDSAEPGRFAISFMNEGSVGCSPRGACCLEGQACTFMTRVACEGLGGVYAGDGVACRPSAMAPPEIWNREVNGAIQYGLCPAGQGDTLTVDSTDFTLAGVEVGVVIPDHVNLGELGIEIEHNGVVVQLWEHVCAGSGSMDVMFSDSGGVVKCATPLVGTIRPMGSLAEFVGMGVGGDWTLRVCDAAPKNDGTLVSWSLVATPGTSECAPPTSCPGDANADGRIDGADLSVLLGQFGAGVPAGSGSDFNGDGAVNGADLSVLLGRFGGAC
jgi:hypothetical protein